MTSPPYAPTDEQRNVIEREGAAFVTACPGAGKTRTMVERARRLLRQQEDRRGVAFLSFTNAAVDELGERLATFGVLSTPLFPSFIGTFDGFLWQFLIVPFGTPGCDQIAKLVPDKSSWKVQPFNNAQALELKCFDRSTGKADPMLAKREGFDAANRNIAPYESLARSMIKSARSRGHVDFEDVRACVQEHLADPAFAKRVGAALAARFREIVVDEAQDSNPADLAIVDWLRQSGITVKVICDPHQSIYEFRGGVTDQLEKFADTFAADERLPMSGNFRSNPAICAAIVALRPPSARTNPDMPLGRHKDDPTPVHILSYRGAGVSPEIGTKFRSLVEGLKLPLQEAPVLASTRASAAKAIGQPIVDPGSHMTLLLARAAMAYHFAFASGNRREALVELHRVILFIKGQIDALSGYHSYLLRDGADDGRWRPGIISIVNGLRFDEADTSDGWLARARSLLGEGLVGRSTIGQRLRNHGNLVPRVIQSEGYSRLSLTLASAVVNCQSALA